MERDIVKKLLEWKDSPFRKPLVLRGARQVGKTWALREFGRTAFKNCAYVTLEEIAPVFQVSMLSSSKPPKIPSASSRICPSRWASLSTRARPSLSSMKSRIARRRLGHLSTSVMTPPQYHVACAGRARAREYEDAVSWLTEAGLVRKVPLNDARGVPVSAYDSPSAFKVYCLDVGLLRRLSRLDATAFSSKSALFTEFKGAFAENYVLQALTPQLDVSPRYWTNEKPKHEVDFLLQAGNDLVPVEVKSGEVVHSASLQYYARKHAGSTPLRVRFSLRNLSLNDGVLNLPLYMADQAMEFIKKAIEVAV